MAESKVDVLMRIAEANLAKANKRFKDSEFDSAVFHASIAVETAANAMIIQLGGQEARNHRAISGLAAVLRRVKPELLQKLEYRQLIEKGRDIQREVVYTRYPVSIEGKWVAPMEYYSREKALMVIENARFVFAIIKKYLEQ
jgi:HEPN domain-containing protein